MIERRVIYHIGHIGHLQNALVHKLKYNKTAYALFLIDYAQCASQETIEFTKACDYTQFGNMVLFTDRQFILNDTIESIEEKICSFYDNTLELLGFNLNSFEKFYSTWDVHNSFLVYLSIKKRKCTEIAMKITGSSVYETLIHIFPHRKQYILTLQKHKALTGNESEVIDELNFIRPIRDNEKQICKKKVVFFDVVSTLNNLDSDDKEKLYLFYHLEKFEEINGTYDVILLPSLINESAEKRLNYYYPFQILADYFIENKKFIIKSHPNKANPQWKSYFPHATAIKGTIPVLVLSLIKNLKMNSVYSVCSTSEVLCNEHHDLGLGFYDDAYSFDCLYALYKFINLTGQRMEINYFNFRDTPSIYLFEKIKLSSDKNRNQILNVLTLANKISLRTVSDIINIIKKGDDVAIIGKGNESDWIAKYYNTAYKIIINSDNNDSAEVSTVSVYSNSILDIPSSFSKLTFDSRNRTLKLRYDCIKIPCNLTKEDHIDINDVLSWISNINLSMDTVHFEELIWMAKTGMIAEIKDIEFYNENKIPGYNKIFKALQDSKYSRFVTEECYNNPELIKIVQKDNPEAISKFYYSAYSEDCPNHNVILTLSQVIGVVNAINSIESSNLSRLSQLECIELLKIINHRHVCEYLATAYTSGNQISINRERGLEYIIESTETSAPSDATIYDVMLRIGTPEIIDEATKLAFKSASNGNTSMMRRLGRAYRDGIGVVRDLNKSTEWYDKAIDRRLIWIYEELATVNWMKTIPPHYLMPDNLNDYLNEIIKHGDVVLGAISDEGSRLWKQVQFPSEFDIFLNNKPKYREGFAFIANTKKNVIRLAKGQECTISMSIKSTNFKVDSQGRDESNNGEARFTIGNHKYVSKKRGLNLIVCQEKGSIIDMVWVDTCTDIELKIQRIIPTVNLIENNRKEA